MKRKKLGYILLIVFWLLLMIIPFVSVVLATRGEIAIGGEHESGFRLFLLQEDENQGLGLQVRRKIGSENSCIQTTVNYFLWKGSNQGIDITYCQCIDPETGLVDLSIACPTN